MSEEVQHAKQLVIDCLNEMYQADAVLFHEKGLCERCLVFRLAHYLQVRLPSYNVDCDYNESTNEDGIRNGMKSVDGVGRYIDIVVHKRLREDFFCLELKKWNNHKGRNKDRRNLQVLTSRSGGWNQGFDYKVGFHLIFGKTRDSTKWQIYVDGTGGPLEVVPASY